MSKLISCLFLSLIVYNISAQPIPPKREFRAAWIATVANIDFPPKGQWNSNVQQEEFIRIIEEFKALNFNAVIFQVRPAADAFYPSSYEPWSAYLTGEQGKRPVPFYDPLEFMIEECHKRGLEFHAWINPYRGTTDANIDQLGRGHPLRTCLLYTSPSPRDATLSRMPSSA